MFIKPKNLVAKPIPRANWLRRSWAVIRGARWAEGAPMGFKLSKPALRNLLLCLCPVYRLAAVLDY